MATCLYCMAAPADLGRYCSGCYGRVFHEDGSPLVLGDPADPWREFNAEADRTMADAKVHAVLAPRMAARWFFPVKVAALKLRPKTDNATQTGRPPNMSTTETPLLTLILDAKAQAALMRSQEAYRAWLYAPAEQNTDSLREERVTAALRLADEISRIAQPDLDLALIAAAQAKR